MNGVPIDPNGVIPDVLGQTHRRYGNTRKEAAVLGNVLEWVESRPRLRAAVAGGGVQ
ncbi:hypothetical protein P3T24_003678 [Paraburkholderia sp. GAS33]